MKPVVIGAGLLGLALAGAGCAVAGGGGGDPEDAAANSQPDSGRGLPRADGGPADADVPDASVNFAPDHLLITEVMTMPSGSVGLTRAEFVEIWNPTGQTFDLSVYYLSDSKAYALVPDGNVSVETGEDFIVRFPVGSSISPDQVLTVAIDGEGFAEAYGQDADYAIKAPGTAAAMTIVAIGNNTDQVGFANAGEGIVLFHWNGLSHLVQDVDMIMTGTRDDPDHVHNILDKTGLTVSGPAAGDDTYRADAFLMGDLRGQLEAATATGRSYKRIALEGSHVRRTGGNGITGHDETSEDIRQTWDNQQSPSGYTAPTPGEIPASLRQQAAELRGLRWLRLE